MSQTRTISALLAEYLMKKNREKWSTRQWRQRAFAQLIAAIGDIDCGSITICEIEDFESFLYGKDLSPNSIRSYLKAIGPVLKYGCRRGYRHGDPFVNFRLPRAVDGEIRIYSDDEIRQLLAAADRLWKAKILAALTAGLRRSEVLNLTISDIDFAAGRITVQPKKDTASTWRWTPKSYQRRIVPMTDDLNRVLSAILIDDVPPGQPYLLLSEERYWYLQHRGSGMTDRQKLCPDENFSPAFRRLRQTAVLQSGTFHDLRRTCLTKWSYALPAHELKKLAGHASIETTMRYYLGVGSDVLDRAKHATNLSAYKAVGATGLEPATS